MPRNANGLRWEKPVRTDGWYSIPEAVRLAIWMLAIGVIFGVPMAFVYVVSVVLSL